MVVAGRVFRPALWPTLATLVLLPFLLSLGLWQWHRAEQKQAMMDTFDTQIKQAETQLDHIDLTQLDRHFFQKVNISGRFDTVQHILLDNQIRQNQAGYLVLSPFLIADSDKAILVNRGWVSGGDDRNQLPDLSFKHLAPNNVLNGSMLNGIINNNVMTIRGRIGRVPNPGILLDNQIASKSTWPLRVQHVDYQELSQALGYDLLATVLLLDPSEQDGYVRDWKPSFGGLGPARHIGYAVQWFALALTLCIIYLLLAFKPIARSSS